MSMRLADQIAEAHTPGKSPVTYWLDFLADASSASAGASRPSFPHRRVVKPRVHFAKPSASDGGAFRRASLCR